MAIGNTQLGKNGITENFILSLTNHFKNHDLMKINVLRSAREAGKEGKEEARKYADELLKHFGPKYTAKIIGFTIIMKKWRKARI